MKKVALSAAIVLGLVGTAYADDPILTKAPPMPAAPAAVPTCTNFWDFISTACPLTWYGITVYGTIDTGVGWEAHSMPFNGSFGPGDDYMLLQGGNKSRFLYSPDAIQQSIIGIKGIEPVWGQTSFIWTFEVGFVPFTGLADAPGTVYGQRGIPLLDQLSSGDGGRYGAIYNSGIGFAGFTNPVWGTLTVGRQNSLGLDGVLAYDPMGGSYAFSAIGFFGAIAGQGYTEDARYTTAVKYRENIGNMRIAALWQFGGYQQDNGSNGAFEAQIGGDIPNFGIQGGTLSVNAIGSYVRDAVAVYDIGQEAAGTNYNQTFAAKPADITSIMGLGKYKVSQWTLYSGVEYIRYGDPSDPYTAFTDVAGDFVCLGCGAFNNTTINNAGYWASTKKFVAWWSGAKYSVTPNLDVIAAYYNFHYGNFDGTTTCWTDPQSNSNCHGSMQFVSALIDWRFAPKWDLYFGVTYDWVANGYAALTAITDGGAYLNHYNIDPTVGLRFRF